MGILNQPNDGLYGVLGALYECVCLYKKVPEKELYSLCAPGDVPDKQVRNTLNRWTQLGLFVVSDKTVTIHPDHVPSRGQDMDEALRGHARALTMHPRNNTKFWEPDASGASDFTRGLSWLLAQNIYTIDTRNHNKIEALELAQVGAGSTVILQNDVRWGGLTAWGTYLGFLWWAQSLVIDPTRAVRSVIPTVFGRRTELAADEFVRAVADQLPVLDRGSYRLLVEATLDKAHWQPPQSRAVSTSLSATIRRLLASGELRTARRADAGDGIQLTGRRGVTDEVYTHFLRGRVK